jgi:hypothetical protein
MQIQVYCESKPHNRDLSNVILNRPASNGGSFLIPTAIPKNIVLKIKSANACRYLSAEDLEDFDMFYSAPGWRYTTEAIQILLGQLPTTKVAGLQKPKLTSLSLN